MADFEISENGNILPVDHISFAHGSKISVKNSGRDSVDVYLGDQENNRWKVLSQLAVGDTASFVPGKVGWGTYLLSSDNGPATGIQLATLVARDDGTVLPPRGETAQLTHYRGDTVTIYADADQTVTFLDSNNVETDKLMRLQGIPVSRKGLRSGVWSELKIADDAPYGDYFVQSSLGPANPKDGKLNVGTRPPGEEDPATEAR